MRAQESGDNSQWGILAMPSVIAAAHELKSPLILIRQLTYQLEQSGTMNAEQQITHERLRLTAERALRLVENLTQASRLNDSLFELEPLEVRSVWHGVVSEMSPLANQMKQHLELVMSKQSLLVVAHRELLPAILLGLCDNGLSHNPQGGTLELKTRRCGDAVVFSVRDNGPTIDTKIFRTLKSRLGRSPLPLSGRPQSSGLGLWIAGHFAEAMASTLSVTRHRGGGMTFSLKVPTSAQLSLI
jgi:two-component system, OmpR family, sensor kinase